MEVLFYENVCGLTKLEYNLSKIEQENAVNCSETSTKYQV